MRDIKKYLIGFIVGLLSVITTGVFATNYGTIGALFEETGNSWVLLGKNIKNNSIDSSKIQRQTIIGDDIQDGAISSVKLKTDSILGTDIKNRSIQGVDVAENTIKSDNIKDRSIQGVDIADKSITAAKFQRSINLVDHLSRSEVDLGDSVYFDNKCYYKGEYIGWGFYAVSVGNEELVFYYGGNLSFNNGQRTINYLAKGLTNGGVFVTSLQKKCD